MKDWKILLRLILLINITNSPVEKFIIFVKESKGGSEEA
jgi:hypothetical protein